MDINFLVGLLIASCISLGVWIYLRIYTDYDPKPYISYKAKDSDNRPQLKKSEEEKSINVNNTKFEQFLVSSLQNTTELNDVRLETLFQLMVYLVDQDNYRNHFRKILREIKNNYQSNPRKWISDDLIITEAETKIPMFNDIKKYMNFIMKGGSGYSTDYYWNFHKEFVGIIAKNSAPLDLFFIVTKNKYSLMNFIVPHLCSLYLSLIELQMRYIITASKIRENILEDNNIEFESFLYHQFFTKDLLYKGFSLLQDESKFIKEELGLNRKYWGFLDNHQMANIMSNCTDQISEIKESPDFKNWIKKGPQYSFMKNNLCRDHFKQFKTSALEETYKNVLVIDRKSYGGADMKNNRYKDNVMAYVENMLNQYRDLVNEEKRMGEFSDLLSFFDQLRSYRNHEKFNKKEFENFLDECQLRLEYIKTMKNIILLYIVDAKVS